MQEPAAPLCASVLVQVGAPLALQLLEEGGAGAGLPQGKLTQHRQQTVQPQPGMEAMPPSRLRNSGRSSRSGHSSLPVGQLLSWQDHLTRRMTRNVMTVTWRLLCKHPGLFMGLTGAARAG